MSSLGLFFVMMLAAVAAVNAHVYPLLQHTTHAMKNPVSETEDKNCFAPLHLSAFGSTRGASLF